MIYFGLNTILMKLVINSTKLTKFTFKSKKMFFANKCSHLTYVVLNFTDSMKWCLPPKIFGHMINVLYHFPATKSGSTYPSLPYIHTLMVVAAMQGANQHIRSSLGFSILLKDTSTCRPGESNHHSFPITRRCLCPWDHSCPHSELIFFTSL